MQSMGRAECNEYLAPTSKVPPREVQALRELQLHRDVESDKVDARCSGTS
jgi:hypothetical protein